MNDGLSVSPAVRSIVEELDPYPMRLTKTTYSPGGRATIRKRPFGFVTTRTVEPKRETVASASGARDVSVTMPSIAADERVA
jgi:hypothetical protein